jgi:glycosyltransferase involved in cell wall biosynthesis
VGRLVSSKRPDIIIEAAKQLNIRLKVVGDGPMRSNLVQRAEKNKNIEFLGRVSDSKRDELYAHCTAFIFAAEEDAGIVPIEAMSYGKPVVCFGRGGAAETVIDGKTGIHFAHQTTESLKAALQDLPTKQFDSNSIRQHTKQFSHHRFQEHIIQAILSIIERH